MITLAFFIGFPILGALIFLLVGLIASAPACFLLALGFCLIGALALPFLLEKLQIR